MFFWQNWNLYYRPWSLTYWCLVMAFLILLFGLLATFWAFKYIMQKKPHLWSPNDTTTLMPSSGFHSARFAGSRTQFPGREVNSDFFLLLWLFWIGLLKILDLFSIQDGNYFAVYCLRVWVRSDWEALWHVSPRSKSLEGGPGTKKITREGFLVKMKR